MTRTARREAGDHAEDLVLTHLRRHGLELLTRNYRCRFGEIDLVMLDGRTLVLVEVRYRTGTSYGGAVESVGPRKQRRLIRAAQHLLTWRPELARLPARFDVVGVTAGDQLQWIRDAFELPAE